MSNHAISLIPANIIKFIAASEIVERPLSVVRELVDNALDAGAANIFVEIEAGGQKMIRVVDDGHGIAVGQLSNAFGKHFSSKTREMADVICPQTKGFRGEALHAISEVSDLTITSRPDGQDAAWFIRPGSDPKPTAGPRRSTKVEVRDLFARVPARKAQLSKPRQDAALIRKYLVQTVISNPNVRFQFRSDNKLIFDIAPGDRGSRIEMLLRKDLRHGDFLNERFEIEFLGEIWDADLVVAERGKNQKSRNSMIVINGFPFPHDIFEDAVEFLWKKEFSITNRKFDVFLFVTFRKPTKLVRFNFHPRKEEIEIPKSQHLRVAFTQALRKILLDKKPDVASVSPQGSDVSTWLGTPIGQYRDGIIIAQNSEGLILVDQHAAQEKLIQCELEEALHKGAILTARKLGDPVKIFDGDLVTQDRLEASQEQLGRMGYKFTFNLAECWLTHVPDILGRKGQKTPVDQHCDILDTLSQKLPCPAGAAQALYRDFANLACKMAIKFGEKISATEQDNFLRRMEANPKSLTCNHGRPTVRVVDHSEILGFFERR